MEQMNERDRRPARTPCVERLISPASATLIWEIELLEKLASRIQADRSANKQTRPGNG